MTMVRPTVHRFEESSHGRDDLVIRAFAPEDWDALCETHERAARHELILTGTDPRAFRRLPEEEDLEVFQQLNTAIVADVDEHVVGFAAWRDRDEWRESGYLSWLYVDPAHHRRGIGHQLLSEAMAALGEQAWTLTKSGNDPAVELYRKHGMHVVTSQLAEAWGYPHTELRLALPTSRKFDPDVPNFGAWIYADG